MNFPSASNIETAHELIRPYIHRTPVLSSETLNRIAGANLWMKAENFQKIGAFKARGALNAVLSLSEEDRKKGIVAHSSGNHAQGIAYACKTAGIPAYIVMPEGSPKVKTEAVREYTGRTPAHRGYHCSKNRSSLCSSIQ
jgi:threonine dehydratase